jgi:nucleoside-diphosphate-sugar epimerase
MTTLIIGGTGFIGRRLIPLLAQRGEEAVCMDINPQTANYSELAKVRVLRGDISQFDDLMGVMTAVKPDRVINLAYYISSDLPPRVAFKLNILGMDNCFEAARLAGCNRVVYASSVAVSGEQNSMAIASSTKTISSMAMCNTRCTRSSTNGRHRITARNTEWRSQQFAPPM